MIRARRRSPGVSGQADAHPRQCGGKPASSGISFISCDHRLRQRMCRGGDLKPTTRLVMRPSSSGKPHQPRSRGLSRPCHQSVLPRAGKHGLNNRRICCCKWPGTAIRDTLCRRVETAKLVIFRITQAAFQPTAQQLSIAEKPSFRLATKIGRVPCPCR